MKVLRWLLRLLRSLAVSLPVFLIFGLATAAQIYSANPPLDWPKDASWLSKAPNPWLLLTAAFSALGAVSAILSFLQKPPYSEAQGKADRQHANQSFAALDAREAGRHGSTLAAVSAIDAKLDAMMIRLEAQGVGVQQIEGFRNAAATLAVSEDRFDREIAEEVVGGNPIDAADRLMAEVEAGRGRNAERARQAARIYAPFAPSKAMAAYAEAVDLDPEDAWSWIELGRLRKLFEGIESARRCFQNALQRVTGEDHASALETELGKLAEVEGDLGEARRHHEAALAIDLRRATAAPESTSRQVYLAISYNKLGDVEVASGNLAAARDRYGAGLAIRERLAAQEPHDTDWRRALSVSYERLGDVEGASDDLDAARGRYEAGLVIREQLAAQEPGNTDWQRSLSVSYNKLGEVEKASGDLDAARSRYEAGLAIRERLAAQEPGNTEWQRDLSVSYERLGDVEVASGNLDAARGRYETGLVIRERLAAQEPGNAGWQRDLSVSYSKLGEIEETSGNLRAARHRYEADLVIAKRLAAREPGNAGWQHDLYITLHRLARLAEMEGDTSASIDHCARAELIMAALVARAPDRPGYAQDLATIRADLARLKS